MSVPVRAQVRGSWARRGRLWPAAAGGVLVLVTFVAWTLSGGWLPWRSADSVTVVSVLDGDTLDVTDAGGVRVRVRVLGIDAPELARRGTRGECYAVQAKARLAELVGNAAVTLTDDPSQPGADRYQRRLAYVKAAGNDVGARLVGEGFAREYHPKDQTAPARSAAYAAAEESARLGGRGLWGKCR